MAFNFPSAPTVGDPSNGYVWDGEKWNVGGSFDGDPMDFPTSPTLGEVAYDVYTWDGEKWNTEEFYSGEPSVGEFGPFGLLFLMMGLRGEGGPPPPEDEIGPIGLLFLTTGVR